MHHVRRIPRHHFRSLNQISLLALFFAPLTLGPSPANGSIPPQSTCVMAPNTRATIRGWVDKRCWLSVQDQGFLYPQVRSIDR
jgi:hypothetical protein